MLFLNTYQAYFCKKKSEDCLRTSNIWPGWGQAYFCRLRKKMAFQFWMGYIIFLPYIWPPGGSWTPGSGHVKVVGRWLEGCDLKASLLTFSESLNESLWICHSVDFHGTFNQQLQYKFSCIICRRDEAAQGHLLSIFHCQRRLTKRVKVSWFIQAFMKISIWMFSN